MTFEDHLERLNEEERRRRAFRDARDKLEGEKLRLWRRLANKLTLGSREIKDEAVRYSHFHRMLEANYQVVERAAVWTSWKEYFYDEVRRADDSQYEGLFWARHDAEELFEMRGCLTVLRQRLPVARTRNRATPSLSSSQPTAGGTE